MSNPETRSIRVFYGEKELDAGWEVKIEWFRDRHFP